MPATASTPMATTAKGEKCVTSPVPGMAVLVEPVSLVVVRVPLPLVDALPSLSLLASLDASR